MGFLCDIESKMELDVLYLSFVEDVFGKFVIGFNLIFFFLNRRFSW